MNEYAQFKQPLIIFSSRGLTDVLRPAEKSLVQTWVC